MNRKHNDNAGSSTLVQQFAANNEVVVDSSSVEHKKSSRILIIEPFYGGSHKQLIDVLMEHIPDCNLATLSAKKWHWRARCSSLILSRLIPKVSTEEILFCSSVLNLAELLGVRPDLHTLRKVVYFHENQLVYPIRAIKERDIQYAYNQIVTCLAADIVVFNSNFNKRSFLDNINSVLKLLPDNRPKGVREDIEAKSRVLYFPVNFPVLPQRTLSNSVLHIVWPHRWEFDKDPECFVRVLLRLQESHIKFHVSMLGEVFKDVPDVLIGAKEKLSEEILHFGYVPSKSEYYNILCNSHVVVSTAKHEFFGVSMLEAVHCGCFPLAPNKLVYPEIYPNECLYENEDDLYVKLKMKCMNPDSILEAKIDLRQFSVENLLPQYLDLLK